MTSRDSERVDGTDVSPTVLSWRDATTEARRVGHKVGTEYRPLSDPPHIVEAGVHARVTNRLHDLATRTLVEPRKVFWVAPAVIIMILVVILSIIGASAGATQVWIMLAAVVVFCSVLAFLRALANRSRYRRDLDSFRTELANRNQALVIEAIRSAQQEIERRRRKTSEQDSHSAPPRGPKPIPLQMGVSHQGAELLVAKWMQYLGATDAQATAFTGDGGIDVKSRRYIAQVKNYSGAVPIASVREFQGVASVHSCRPLFFTSGQYPDSVVQFADLISMPLFRYSAEAGTLIASNASATSILSSGL